jgi:hypothetical protein
MRKKDEILSEHEEQVLVVSRCRKFEYGKYLIAIPNGGKRNIVTAQKLKAEGVLPGVSDLFLALPIGQYFGLWLEMKKRKNGKLSKSQKDWIDLMRSVGYAADVAYGADHAMEIINEYLGER